MGLYIQSLDSIPVDVNKQYFIYLLDYGWTESLSDVMIRNFNKMAVIAEQNDAVLIRGTVPVHFEDQVLSWHHINGENAEELLPAILITNRNPHSFKERAAKKSAIEKENLKLILIPLKRFCSTTTEVVDLITKLLNDVIARKDLSEFRVAKKISKGRNKALADSLVLAPSEDGEFLPLENLFNYLQDEPVHDGHHINATPPEILAVRSRFFNEMIMLYPHGSEQENLWARAGGDVSIFVNILSRKEHWRLALNYLWNGTGGKDISLNSLLASIKEDFPQRTFEIY